MSALSSYYKRQLILAHTLISDYKIDKLSLYNLIYKLEALFDLLEELDYGWYKRVKSLWFELEVMYSIKCASNEDNNQILTNKEALLILDIVNKIDDEIVCYLDKEEL